MLDEVCELLRAAELPTVRNTPEARVHAYTRFRQGYRARDLVREISLLRTTLLDHLRAHYDPREARNGEIFQAIKALNLYLDEEMRYGVAIYTECHGDCTAPRPT